MATAKLTQTFINNLPVPEKGYWVNDEVMPGLRLYVGASGSKAYYISYKNAKGKKDSYKIGDEKLFTPVQARETAKRILAEMAVTGTDIKQERKRDGGVTLHALCDAYLAAGGSKFTASMVQNFKDYLDRAAEEITALEISTWRVKEKERTGNKDKSINHKVTALKTVLNFGVENELITVNPLAKLKKLKEVDSSTKTRYLTEDERKRFLAALDKLDSEARAARHRTRQHAKGQHLPNMEGWAFANYFKPLVLLSLHTGIRRHALLSLRWEDVDFDSGSVILRADTAKNKKSNIIPLNTTALGVLRQWHEQRTDDNSLVFPSPQTGGVMDNCNSYFARLLREAGITNFRWHDMRHDFASRLVMAGVDLNTVRELMTHSDISMTLRYAHLAPEKTRAAVELIS